MTLDLLVVARRALRHPWRTAAIVALIALAVGVNTAVFSQVNDILLSDVPYPEPSRLVRIWTGVRDGPPEVVTGTDYQALAGADVRLLSSIAAYRHTEAEVGLAKMNRPVRAAFVTPSLFETLAISPRCSSPSDLNALLDSGTPVVLLRESYARQLVGEASCAPDQTLIVDGRRHVLAGFVTDAVRVPDQETLLYIAFEPDDSLVSSGGAISLKTAPVQVLGRLAPGATLQTATQEFERSTTLRAGRTVRMTSLRDGYVGQIVDSVLLLQVLAGFVMIVTVLNVSQMQLAQAYQRSTDAAIRLALGASFWQSHRDLVLESVLLAGASGALAVPAYRGISGLLDRFGPANGVSGLAEGDATLVLGAGLAAVVTCMLLPLLPVLARAYLPPAVSSAWASGGVGRVGGGRSAITVSRGLLAGQATIMTAGVAVGMLLTQSTVKMLSTDLGFDADDVWAAPIHLRSDSLAERLVALSLLLDDAERVAPSFAIASTIPLTVTTTVQVWIPDEVERAVTANRVDASSRYNEIMGITLRAGRWFNRTDGDGSEAALVISEAFANSYLDGRALGRSVRIGPQAWTVVGVVGDVRARGVREPIVPTIYVPLSQSARGSMQQTGLLKRAELLLASPRVPGAPESVFNDLASRGSSRLSLGSPRQIGTLVSRSTQSTRFLTGVALLFAALTVALGVLAGAAATSQYLSLRRVDIAVRMALGASPGSTRRLVAAVAMIPIGVGVTAGLALGYIASVLLRAHLFGVTSAAVSPYVTAAAVVFVACLLSIAPTLRRVTALNVAETLKAN